MARHRRRIYPVWITSFLASFAVYAVLAIFELGWTAFWHGLHHPHANSNAFELLAASLGGAYAVGITVYVGGSATVIVTVSERSDARYHAFVECIGSWWLFFPTLFWYVCTNLLVGDAWGFPPLLSGIVTLIVIGLLALLSLAALSKRVALFLSEDAGIASESRSERHGSTLERRAVTPSPQSDEMRVPSKSRAPVRFFGVRSFLVGGIVSLALAAKYRRRL